MEYLTVAEVAKKLRVDESTVRIWIRTGKLPAIRVGRQYRVDRAAYEQFIGAKEKPQDNMVRALAFAH